MHTYPFTLVGLPYFFGEGKTYKQIQFWSFAIADVSDSGEDSEYKNGSSSGNGSDEDESESDNSTLPPDEESGVS